MFYKMKKVSLISPCYNGEKYVTNFLESLVAQTYSNVEFIFINDGSTDKTEEIFNSYKPALEAKGWTVIYIYQENSGQASALNKGLEIFTGEYLIFPDSDDILYPEHIAKKVDFMEQHPEFGFAFCTIDTVKEDDLNNITYHLFRKSTDNENLTDDLIERRNILWTPIGNIFRSNEFIKVVPSRNIYAGRGGQNFQMLFPMACAYKHGYIDESLGKYVIRKESHSRLKKTLIQRNTELFDIWLNTILNLNNVNDNEKAYNINKSFENFMKDILNSYKVENINKKVEYSINFKKFLVPFFKKKKIRDKIKIYLFGIHLLTIKG